MNYLTFYILLHLKYVSLNNLLQKKSVYPLQPPPPDGPMITLFIVQVSSSQHSTGPQKLFIFQNCSRSHTEYQHAPIRMAKI